MSEASKALVRRWFEEVWNPATGRQTSFTGMGFARVRNGRLVEGWNNFDQLGMLQQLGAVQRM